MSSLVVVPLVLGIFMAVWLLASWVDNKYNWQFVDWFEGRTNNPFKPKSRQPSAQYTKQLEERIQILEKLVTEPAYELNKKINALK